MELADYEYTVAQKHEGKWKTYKTLTLLGYVAFAGAYFAIAFATTIGIPLVAILPLFLWMLIFFTYKYVNPEYKYKITEGNLYFFRITGKKEKEIFKTRICDATYIMPLSEGEAKIRDVEPKKIYSALPSLQTADPYVIIFKNEMGEPLAFTFKATSDGLKSLRFYNKNTVMTTTEV